jgi:GT2 family glycosyltransferase
VEKTDKKAADSADLADFHPLNPLNPRLYNSPGMITVVVVNWNGKALLADCLTSLRAQTFSDLEVILVDNGSTDGSAEWVRDNFPEVRLVALQENRGFAGGNNEGILQARGEWIALLNNDATAEPDWLERLYCAVQGEPGVGFAASRVVLTSGVLDSAGDGMTIAGVPYKRGHGRSPAGVLAEPTEVFGASGCGVLLRRAMLDQIGLLDEDFFCIYEDGDLNFRARLAGFRCIYVPDAIVIHRLHGTLGRLSKSYVFYGQRNMEYLYFKNMPGRLLWRHMPVHLLSNLLGFGYFTLRGRPFQFVKGKAAFIRNIGATLRKRREVQKLRRADDDAIDAMLDRRWLASRLAGKF